MAKPLGLEKDPTCGSNRTNVRVNFVYNQCYGLSVLPVFLYSESDTQLGWEYLDISIKRMDIDGHPTFVVEFPISREESFGDAFT